MSHQIESGGLHKGTGGGGRWREGWKKREKEGIGKCFSTVHHLSPHTQQLCQSNAPWHVWKTRGQIAQERYKNAFNSSLPSAQKKYLCTKGVDLKLPVFPANLCQPVFPEKNVVSFGKQHGLARLSYEEVLRVTKTLHNGTFLVTRTPATLVWLCKRTAVRLATRVCLCWISQTQRK